MREIKFRAWWGGKMEYDTHHNPDVKCEVMQYTGLKDKNGTPIYEGDLVREIFHDVATDHVIQWSDVNSGFWMGTARHLNKGSADDLEVIGNVYENERSTK